MTRLVDRLLTSPVSCPAETPQTVPEHRKLIAAIKDDLRTGSEDTGGFPAPTIVIDNVADFIFADPRDRWDVADFPNAAPPWAVAWWRHSSFTSTRERLTSASHSLRSNGGAHSPQVRPAHRSSARVAALSIIAGYRSRTPARSYVDMMISDRGSGAATTT